MTIIEEASSIIIRHQQLNAINQVQGVINDLNGLAGSIEEFIEDFENLSTKYLVIRRINENNVEFRQNAGEINAQRETLRQMLNQFIHNPTEIDQQQLRVSIQNFKNVVDPVIRDSWKAHADLLKCQLISIIDLTNFQNILPELTEQISIIRAARQAVFDEVRSCPATINRYNIINKRVNQTIELQDQLLAHFPETVREFLGNLYSNNGASLDELTEEVKNWLRENNLDNNLCIKPRPQNG